MRKKRLEALTWFFLVRAYAKDAHDYYDCEVCEKLGSYKGRVCFDRDEQVSFDVPEYDEKGQETRETRTVFLDKDEFWELIVEISAHRPQIPIFHLVNRFKVCLVSAGSRELEQLISMEAAARDYHVMPFGDGGGGWLDQSNVVIEAFDIIRSTRNKFELEKMDKDIPKREK